MFFILAVLCFAFFNNVFSIDENPCRPSKKIKREIQEFNVEEFGSDGGAPEQVLSLSELEEKNLQREPLKHFLKYLEDSNSIKQNSLQLPHPVEDFKPASIFEILGKDNPLDVLANIVDKVVPPPAPPQSSKTYETFDLEKTYPYFLFSEPANISGSDGNTRSPIIYQIDPGFNFANIANNFNIYSPTSKGVK